MIQAVFQLGGDQIIIEVDSSNVMFCDIGSTGSMAPIDGLRLSKGGVLREFPDLEEDPEWKDKAINRFKDHIKKLKTEMERINYIIEDLKKHGYEGLYIRRQGFRPQKIK